MTPDTETVPKEPTPETDLYFYGWRMVPRWDDKKGNGWEKVPLTAWDVLHPEEDDFIVQTDDHDRDCHYLKQAFELLLRGRTDVDVFTDLRIDWQIPGLGVHGPDVIVFEGLTAPWDGGLGTFLVKDRGANPVLIAEVVSPNTREADLVEKVREYHLAGVPVYVIVNRQETRGRTLVTVFGYRYTPDGYVRLPEEEGGVRVESLGAIIRPIGDRAMCLDRNGEVIPDYLDVTDQRDVMTQRAEAAETERAVAQARADEAAVVAAAEKVRADEAAAVAATEKARADEAAATAAAEKARADAEKAERLAEKTRADAEKARADAEKAERLAEKTRADAEKARADEVARKFAELEAEIRRLRGEPPPSPAS